MSSHKPQLEPRAISSSNQSQYSWFLSTCICNSRFSFSRRLICIRSSSVPSGLTLVAARLEVLKTNDALKRVTDPKSGLEKRHDVGSDAVLELDLSRAWARRLLCLSISALSTPPLSRIAPTKDLVALPAFSDEEDAIRLGADFGQRGRGLRTRRRCFRV